MSLAIPGGAGAAAAESEHDEREVATVEPAGPPLGPQDANGQEIISAYHFEWNGISIPVLTTPLIHMIRGDGLTVDSANITYYMGPAYRVCNHQIVWVNRYGNTVYSSRSTPLRSTCSWGGFNESMPNKTPWQVRSGVVCAQLYVAGDFRGEQCHNVTAS